MSYLFTGAICAFLAMVSTGYYYEVIFQVRKEQQHPVSRQLYKEWIDFIYANIASCSNQYHCHQCRKMIILFDQRFRGEIPSTLFTDRLQNMYTRLDNKYRKMAEEDAISSLTITELLQDPQDQ